MRASAKVILIMIDGLSADYLIAHRAYLPTLAGLAERGLYVKRLRSDVPATSMPGRTSLLTGLPAQRHGIYGNYILDGDTFRCASPDDVLVPTLARQAKEAGLDVASIGYAMVRPEDTSVFHPPWWVRGWLEESRFAKASLATYDGPKLAIKDPDARLSGLRAAPLPTASPPQHALLAKVTTDLASDGALMRMAARIACSSAPPDLILSEIAATDPVQHLFGYASAISHWSLTAADLFVSSLLHQLSVAGRDQDYILAVTSDHGHSAIETAIFPDVVIPGALWQSEGATLHVAAAPGPARERMSERLAAFGVESHESEHVPAAARSRVATFTAPAGHSFEERPRELAEDQPTGKPRYVSSHGLRPGSPADDRPCIFFGPGIPREVHEYAAPEQFAPTLASALGLPLDPYPAPPLRYLS